jgi:hypothetical protein
MPFRDLDDHAGEWHGQLVRVSRLVARPGRGAALLGALNVVADEATGSERVFVGYHMAPDHRTVVLLQSVWASPEAPRAGANPETPPALQRYGSLVESWSMEYFEDHFDSSRRSAGVAGTQQGSLSALQPVEAR